MTDFRTFNQTDLKGKRVLVRVDLNVPMDNGRVSDLTRIERIAPTVAEIADLGGRVILLSHFGRPKGRNPEDSLKPVAGVLSCVMKRPIGFSDDCIGPAAAAAVGAMRNGDILCLENTRFHAGEEKNDIAFVAALAALGDIWVNDAFSVAHRAHASTEGLGHALPAYAGRTMQAELLALRQALEAPERPVAAIVGGSKISTKLDLLGNLVAKVDALIIGGGMANTFLAAQGHAVGKSLCEHNLAATARDILAKAEKNGCAIVLPVDAVVAKELKALAPSRVVPVDAVAADEMILDIGPRTIEHVVSLLARVKTLGWNGPFGAFWTERFDNGTIAVAEAAAETDASRQARLRSGRRRYGGRPQRGRGWSDRFTYVSTGRGRVPGMGWMGRTLPGVAGLGAGAPALRK